MCASDEGHVFVVWYDDRDGLPAIWFNRSLDAGLSWMTGPVRVSQGDAASTSPDIACTGDSVYVAWEDTRDGELDNRNIYFARSTDGGDTWDDEQLLDDDPDGDGMSLGPRIAAIVRAVYVGGSDCNNGADDIYAAASHDGGASFALPERVDADEAGSAHSAWPQIAAEAGGVVYVAWEDSRAAGSDVYFARSGNGGGQFEPDVRLDGGDDPGEHDSFAPTLGAAEGMVYVAWHDDRAGEYRDIYMNWSQDYGESFASEAVRVDSDGEGFSESLFPVVAVRDGVGHIAWQDARNTGFDIYYRKVVDGEFAAEEKRLDTDSSGFANSLYPKITAADAGIVVAWQDLRDDVTAVGYDDLYYNWSSDEGENWALEDLRIDSIEPGSHYAVDLTVTVYESELLAAWTDGRNGTADVYFHGLALGAASEYTPVEE
jgi:hypothetical protein